MSLGVNWLDSVPALRGGVPKKESKGYVVPDVVEEAEALGFRSRLELNPYYDENQNLQVRVIIEGMDEISAINLMGIVFDQMVENLPAEQRAQFEEDD